MNNDDRFDAVVGTHYRVHSIYKGFRICRGVWPDGSNRALYFAWVGKKGPGAELCLQAKNLSGVKHAITEYLQGVGQ